MQVHDLFDSTIQTTIDLINQVGYFGIFIGMFLESTMFPLPSELIMIPAGISAAKGGFHIYIALLCGVAGNVLGALFSYYLAAHYGRRVLFKIGKYFFIDDKTIIKIEKYFKAHGPISILIGRVLPGFRHFISLPAGLAKMHLSKFTSYTTIGATLWSGTLLALGFIIGENQDLIKQHLHTIIISCVVICAIALAAYFTIKKQRT